jgi:hypothetical protein
MRTSSGCGTSATSERAVSSARYRDSNRSPEPCSAWRIDRPRSSSSSTGKVRHAAWQVSGHDRIFFAAHDTHVDHVSSISGEG